MSKPRLQLVLALLGALVVAGRAQAMQFRTVADPAVCGAGRCLLATGAIQADDPKALAAFLKAEKAQPGETLVLDSQGGNVIASLKIGNILRRAGLNTTVQAWDEAAGAFKRGGECASACAYAFLGGAERRVGDGARIGVHQIYAGEQGWALSAEDGMWIMSMVATHVKRQCGSLDLLIPTLQTPPQSVYWLSPVEMARFGVTTPSAAA
jgi:hypothetical protein